MKKRTRLCGEPERIKDSARCPDLAKHDTFDVTRADIGAKIAEVLERDLHDGGAWGRILDNAGLTPAERAWADAHVRWTLLDEEDGVDLLQDEEAKS